MRRLVALLILLAIPTTAMAAGQQAESQSTETGASAAARDKSLWEIGLAGGALSMPQYAGSDQRFTLPFIVPYLIYRGKFLRADRHGIRGRLFSSDRLLLNLDFGFGLPVRNDNNARRGMPALHLSGEVGPQAIWIIAKDRSSKLSLHLPVRFAADIRRTYLGWIFQPGLSYERYDLLDEPHKLTLRLEGGILYASQRYNQYYYGVDPQYATATRPAYRARQGLHSVFLYGSLNYRLDATRSIWTMVRMGTLAGGVNANSPLVRRRFYFTAGLGFSWSVWFSEAKVSP